MQANASPWYAAAPEIIGTIVVIIVVLVVNLAISGMGRPKVEVLAGINLPMLVKLAKVRDECPLADAVAAAQDSGRKYITIASRVLSGK